uniref:Fibronectin type-III domain-containing protein n=1 Tax=Astyanax mexicanus TaxID=7994 RepID=A0A8B9H4G2_ASTMX
MKVPEIDTTKQEDIKTIKADKMIFEKKADHEKELKKYKKPSAKPTTNSTGKDHIDETRNNTLLKDGKGQEQTKRSKSAVLKTIPYKQIQTDLPINPSTKQEMTEKLSTKQVDLKDMLVNHNITQTNEKKTNGTSKVLSRLVKKAKASTDYKTSSEKEIHPQSNVTSSATTRAENDKKLLQRNVIIKGVASGHQKVEKNGNGTVSIEKETKQLQGNATLPKEGPSKKKKNVEKHINVTSLTEKDQKLHQVNMTLLRFGASSNKNMQKHENIHKSSRTGKTQFQACAILLKDGSSGKKKVYSTAVSPEKNMKLLQSNVTTVIKRGKNNLDSHVNATAPSVTTTHKEVTSCKKKVEKHFSTEKEKKTQLVNATHVKEEAKEEASGSKKVEILRNVTSTEKDKKLQQVDITAPLKDTTFTRKKHVNVTTPEKDKKLYQVSVTLPKEEASGKRKVEKHVNVMVSTVKNRPRPLNNATLPKESKNKIERHVNVTILPDKKRQQVNVTLLKEEASENKKINTITVSEEKNKKQKNKQQLRSDATAGLQEKATGKEKLESQRNTTTSNKKDKVLQQDRKTSALKEGGGTKKKDLSCTKKYKNIHVSRTTSLNKATFVKKRVAEKDKKITQANVTLLKQDVVIQKKVDVVTVSEEKSKKHLAGSRLNTLNIDAKTTKLKDISSVEVHNVTATGFMISWEALQGDFKNFTVTRREVFTGNNEEVAQEAGKSLDSKDKEDTENITKNEAGINTSNKTSKVHSGQADRNILNKFSQVLSGTARSFHFTNLQPQTRYLVSLYSSRPGGPHKLYRLFVSTGPEPPKELVFSNITETSLSVSWTKPKSIVTGFRVTYTNTGNGDNGSISVDSQLSHVLISKLSAGFSYEISVRSILGTIESEPTTASVTTVADPPTDLQAVNITDTKALIVWKKIQAKVDHYILSYTSAKSPNVTVTVMLSGSSVEHQLRGLHRYTLYTVKLTSQISNHQSRSISTTFKTTSGVKLQAVIPTEITFSSAVISWKAPHLAFRSYRLTYQHDRNSKEVVLNPTVTQYELTDLAAFSNYTVKVDGEREGQYINIVSSAFTTGKFWI